MSEYKTHKPGTFSWVDLGTTDTVGAKTFYTEIFGWETQDIPMGEGASYTFFNINGKPVAAMYELVEQQKAMNLPPHWMTYITVDDAAATLAKANELGGKDLTGCMEVMDEGLSGMVQDPEGAVIGLWQPKTHHGIAYKNIPGTLCWVEHASRESEKSIAFFEKLFGWTSQTQDMGGMLYTTFSLAEEAVAGLYIMPPELAEVPPHWLPYFLTDNIDLLIEKSERLSGKILMPKMFIEGVGHFAVAQDPQGGVFGVLQAG